MNKGSLGLTEIPGDLGTIAVNKGCSAKFNFIQQLLCSEKQNRYINLTFSNHISLHNVVQMVITL